jgi:hypothetical protein
MSNTLCEGCGQHSFLIPLHGGKGGPPIRRRYGWRSRLLSSGRGRKVRREH